MKTDNLALSLIASALIGFAQMVAMIYFWAYMSIYVSIIPPLVARGIIGTELWVTVSIFDFIVNLLICLPAAYALCSLRPQRLWLYLAAAVLPGFFWQYRLLLGGPPEGTSWTLFVPGVLVALFILPVATLIVRRWRSHQMS